MNNKTVSQSATYLDTYFYLAQALLKNYYENIDLGSCHTIRQKWIHPNVVDCMSKKIEQKRYMCTSIKETKENYQLRFTLLSFMESKVFIELKVLTEASFCYTGCNIPSGFGQVSNLIFHPYNQGGRVVDWYLDDDYDHPFPGKHLGIPDTMTTFNAVTASAMLHSLDKKKIVSYALNNAKSSSPASGGLNVPYYDFSQISGNYDCTNFVSHALLAGGAVPYHTGGKGISSTGWYYVNLNTRSSSWSGVPYLHSFIINNKIKGPAGHSFSYERFDMRDGYPYEKGDILQFYSSSYGNWRHSTIVTGYYMAGDSNEYQRGALVTGRTSNGSYNYNTIAETIYPGDRKRIIKLSGYYH
ncbi:MAG: hypothetical protein GX962_03915 [Epulopiscium sp.]|nr:hypothetical protein [Candidatus Epulonipiscium sp.]